MTDKLSLQDFHVREANWQQDGNMLRNLRRLVFIVEQKVPVDEEIDGRDGDCWHFLATDTEDVPIGTGRLMPEGQIGRMAVLRDHRGRGIGAAILDAAVEKARHLGFESVYLNAQTHALGFYEKAGFIKEGPEFEEAGIAHQRMTRVLRPLADQVQRITNRAGELGELGLKPFTIKEVTFAELTSQIRQIRQLVTETGMPHAQALDDNDADRIQFVAEEDDGQIVGCVRMSVTGSIEHLAVLSHYRRQGIGTSLLEACVAKARRFSLSSCSLLGPPDLAGLFERAGFRPAANEAPGASSQAYVMDILIEDVQASLQRPEPTGPSFADSDHSEQLGRDKDLLLLRSEADFRQAILAMCSQARMNIRIWSPVLDHKLFDSQALQTVVSALARRNKYTRIEFLLYDPHRVVKNGHALLNIARKLPSSIAFRVVHPELRALNQEFVVADDCGAIYRLDAEEYNGWANFNNVSEAGRLQRQFTSAWESGLFDPNLRQLRI